MFYYAHEHYNVAQFLQQTNTIFKITKYNALEISLPDCS